jgi:hypothetical protein
MNTIEKYRKAKKLVHSNLVADGWTKYKNIFTRPSKTNIGKLVEAYNQYADAWNLREYGYNDKGEEYALDDTSMFPPNVSVRIYDLNGPVCISKLLLTVEGNTYLVKTKKHSFWGNGFRVNKLITDNVVYVLDLVVSDDLIHELLEEVALSGEAA